MLTHFSVFSLLRYKFDAVIQVDFKTAIYKSSRNRKVSKGKHFDNELNGILIG